MIPLFKVFMSDEVTADLEPVIKSGYIGEGSKTQEFEQRLCEFVENENLVVVNSGTSAITLALLLAGVGHGSKVVSTPMTCLATNMAITGLGAEIIWADIDPSTGNVSQAGLHWALTGRSNGVDAIVIVDWGGNPCDYNEINRCAESRGIPVVLDACQSFGGKYNGQPIGNHCTFTAFSFQAIKYLTTGDGGALVCPDKSTAATARLKRWFGLDRSAGASMRCSQDPLQGYKFQSNDIVSTIGLANLKHADRLLRLTASNASKYNACFSQLERVRLLKSYVSATPAYWLYTLLVDESDKFIDYMETNGVTCSKVHARNDTKQLFEAFRCELPGVDEFDKHHVCIPVGWWLTPDEVNKIINLVKEF